jgi:hypothetical protein
MSENLSLKTFPKRRCKEVAKDTIVSKLKDLMISKNMLLNFIPRSYIKEN